ncbi:hypothetical protein SAMN05444000_1452 [Shimia gijangensis]|uniref:Uncharacterized protein n=1 Tax=Shimia gijangensis TaxID=1470563 RepID=A0A1M6TTM6_9RHOB|nr:hypothetical protein [Shimia gijangensis]SHK60279.1 hypothetical protein SAMN05444000_1452 [Shimia gijangensis]
MYDFAPKKYDPPQVDCCNPLQSETPSEENCSPLQSAQLQPENCSPLQQDDQPPSEFPGQFSRETGDDYVREVIRVGRYRVIVSKDEDQWIIQKQAFGATTKSGITWKAIGHHLKRHSLTRVWQEKSKMPVPEQVLAFPENFPYRK